MSSAWTRGIFVVGAAAGWGPLAALAWAVPQLQVTPLALGCWTLVWGLLMWSGMERLHEEDGR